MLNVARAAGTPEFKSPFDVRSVPELLAFLNSRSEHERINAAQALRLHGDDAEAAAALIKLLQCDEAPLRREAARSIGAFGGRAAEAIPILVSWLSAEPKGRVAALEAFALLGKDAGVSSALVKFAAEDEWPDGVDFEASLQGALTPHGSEAVPALMSYVRTGSPPVRARAARSLGLLGAAAADAVGELIELSGSADDSEASAAFKALRSIGAEKNPACAAYFAGVIQENLFATRRLGAVLSLGAAPNLPEDAQHARLDALIKALDDPDESVCGAASATLAEIGEAAVPALTQALIQGGKNTRRWSVKALSKQRAAADKVVPLLMECINGGNPVTDRREAAELLQAYAPEHEEIIEPLVNLLKARDATLAHAAMKALQHFGIKARPAVMRLLSHRNPLIRQRAAETFDVLE
jgi:HEAT repeat protein